MSSRIEFVASSISVLFILEMTVMMLGCLCLPSVEISLTIIKKIAGWSEEISGPSFQITDIARVLLSLLTKSQQVLEKVQAGFNRAYYLQVMGKPSDLKGTSGTRKLVLRLAGPSTNKSGKVGTGYISSSAGVLPPVS